MATSSFFADRVCGLRPSAIREILKLTQSPDVISFAGGLPAPELFSVQEIAAAAQTKGIAPLGKLVASEPGTH